MWRVLTPILFCLGAGIVLMSCGLAPELPGADQTAALLPAPAATSALAPRSEVTPSSTATPAESVTPRPTAVSSATSTATPTAAPTALPTPDGVYREAAIPILMYHYLSDPPPQSDRYRRDLSVSPALFEQHLVYLRDQAYQSITLEQLLRHLALGEPLPEKPIIITFDDGYADNYTNAFPLLQKYGFSGVFFVVTELAERASMGMTAPDGSVYANEYMSWERLQEMIAAGMEIQCHARVHEDLTDMDDDRLAWQVLGCREMIESRLGIRPRFVSYPAGLYDERVIAAFAADGYWGGITTHQGDLQDSDAPFEVHRLRIRSTTTVDELAELLAWDWQAGDME